MRSRRKVILLSIAVVACLLIAWLAAGRQISLALDSLFTIRYASLPANPIGLYEGGLQIGEESMSFDRTDYRPPELTLTSANTNRCVLELEGRSFVLGSTTGKADFPRSLDLTPEKGDEVTFTVERSLMSWPTPFEINFMTGRSPSWKRNLYYHLRWKKASGASLEMVWRYQQWFYGIDGWTTGTMTGPDTGLIKVDIHPAS